MNGQYGETEQTSGEVPPPLFGASITVHTPPPDGSGRLSSSIFVFGGRLVAEGSSLSSDLYCLDPSTLVWTRTPKNGTGSAPTARYCHAMESYGDCLLLFGGLGYSSSQTSRISVLGTLHLFHVPTLMWLPCISPLSPSPLDPTPRFAVLTSVSSSHLIVAGGQTLSGETVLETNVFDLKRKAWVSKKEGSEGITGAYGWSSTMMEAKSWSVKTDETQEGLPFSCEEEFGGEVFCWTSAGPPQERRSLEIVNSSSLFNSSPDLTIDDATISMSGDLSKPRGAKAFPPALDFPSGGVLGNHLVVSGTAVSRNGPIFSLWSLEVDDLQWTELGPGLSPRWSTSVIVPEAKTLFLFGDEPDSPLTDTKPRPVGFGYVASVNLESFGIYQPPTNPIALPLQKLALLSLDGSPADDFEILCDDGRTIACTRQILVERWEWFRSLRLGRNGSGKVDTHPSFPNTPRGRLMSRNQLHLPEPYPIAMALIQYFYTLSLRTPLQRQPLVISTLLQVARVYDLQHLEALCLHNLHLRLNLSTAEGILETAEEAGCRGLSSRAQKILDAARQKSRRPSREPPSSAPSLPTISSSPTNFDLGRSPQSKQRNSKQESEDESPFPSNYSNKSSNPPNPPLPQLAIPSSSSSSGASSPVPSSRSANCSTSQDPLTSPSVRAPFGMTPQQPSFSDSLRRTEYSPLSHGRQTKSRPERRSGGLYDADINTTSNSTSPDMVRPAPKRHGSLPPLSWSASSEASTADDEVLRSPPSLPRPLPILSKEVSSPPANESSSPTSTLSAIPNFHSKAPSIGRNLSASVVRRPLLRRPHSIDTIVSVLSTSDSGVDHYASDTLQASSALKNRDTASTASSASSAVAQSIVDRRGAASFVSVGGLSSPNPGSKEAKKLEKAFKDLMKAQDKLNAAHLKAEENARKASHAQWKREQAEAEKARQKEADAKEKASIKAARRAIEDKRARILAEERKYMGNSFAGPVGFFG
ncbi:hypothetical protein BDY24DRAFT_442880 [Mrakia frigida]|uniref:uncharacterized protein n=1 Tax=Mrakia frigida TaxID=29902 RepID=UPI003FCBF3E8